MKFFDVKILYIYNFRKKVDDKQLKGQMLNLDKNILSNGCYHY